MYLKHSLSNKIYLKEQLFDFKMTPSKFLDDNLHDLNKILLDLKDSGEDISDDQNFH